MRKKLRTIQLSLNVVVNGIKFLLLVFIFCCQVTRGDTYTISEKHFEWGAGFLSIYGNQYRGSDQGKFWLFPMPYFTYTSKKLEAEPSFIRGIIYSSERFSIKISLMPGLSVSSDKNKARSGMPSLDYTLEVGPMIIFNLWQSNSKTLTVNFEWPVRESFATDFSYLRAVGLFTVPYLNIIHTPCILNCSWRSEFSVSPMFADQKYHQYFYGVDKQFVRSDRPFYKAQGGYSGFQTTWVLNTRFHNFAIMNFLRWDYLNNAVFVNSPLVKTKNYFIGGLGLFWLIK